MDDRLPTTGWLMFTKKFNEVLFAAADAAAASNNGDSTNNATIFDSNKKGVEKKKNRRGFLCLICSSASKILSTFCFLPSASGVFLFYLEVIPLPCFTRNIII